MQIYTSIFRPKRSFHDDKEHIKPNEKIANNTYFQSEQKWTEELDYKYEHFEWTTSYYSQKALETGLLELPTGTEETSYNCTPGNYIYATTIGDRT